MEKIIEKIKKLEEFVAQNDLVQDAVVLKSEYGVDKAEDLQKTLLEQEDKDRVLRIGILGRVKAGKSSFLNALVFDGNDILPKAATPMTAALTILEYGDSTSAEVDFYTQEDLDGIKNEHEQYLKLIQQLTEAKIEEMKEQGVGGGKVLGGLIKKSSDTTPEQEEKAKTLAIQEAKKNERLFSSYDQYERISKSGISNISELNQYRKLQANNIDELKNKLKDFVASDGKFMPFTKSVTLKLNNESLKDLQIIDSPGINDPVASRGERTRELLKDCDVCFLVSPSGQFLSAEDMDLLDRLTVREGVQEFYVVASQVDSQLLGSCRDDANGVLSIALQKVEDALSTHMRSTFAQQKQNYPADFSKSILLRFDKLMSHPVICTSGMAFSLLKNWDNQSQWNEELAFVFGNLEAEYQDFFSNPEMAKSNLEKIANIDRIKEIIENVRIRKEEIQKTKQEEFLRVKTQGVNQYKSELLKILKEKEKRLQEGDLKKIKEDKDNMMQIKKRGSLILDNLFCDKVDGLKKEIQDNLLKKAEGFFSKTETISKNAQREEIERKSYTSGWWIFKKTHYYDDRCFVVSVGDIANCTQEMILNLEVMFKKDVEEMVSEWKEKLSTVICKKLRDAIGDKNVDIALIESATRRAGGMIKWPEVILPKMPQELNGVGKIEGYQAEEYMKKFNSFYFEYHLVVNNFIFSYTSDAIDGLKSFALSRSEERRVGKECASMCRSRWSPYH